MWNIPRRFKAASMEPQIPQKRELSTSWTLKNQNLEPIALLIECWLPRWLPMKVAKWMRHNSIQIEIVQIVQIDSHHGGSFLGRRCDGLTNSYRCTVWIARGNNNSGCETATTQTSRSIQNERGRTDGPNIVVFWLYIRVITADTTHP